MSQKETTSTAAPSRVLLLSSPVEFAVSQQRSVEVGLCASRFLGALQIGLDDFARRRVFMPFAFIVSYT